MIDLAKRAAEVYFYCPATGTIRWRIASYRNVRKPGDKAGGKSGPGYEMVWIDGKNYGAHRVVWSLVHGEWPSQEIDHINGDRSDNRIENLRLASRQENAQNLGLREDNKSGVKGVFWHKNIAKWWAYINKEGQRMTLGYFDNLFEAAAARKSAEARLFGEFART